MKIAIPVVNERVAPRFGISNTLLIVTEENGEILSRKTISFAEMSPFEKIRYIKNNEIKVLICLGIEMTLYNYLNAFGVQVIPGIYGYVEEILKLYLTGDLISGPLPGPGFCYRVRARRGFRGGRGYQPFDSF